MINICRKAFFYEQLKLGKGSFFEVPLRASSQLNNYIWVKRSATIVKIVEASGIHCFASATL
jgi:hypothetical protein